MKDRIKKLINNRVVVLDGAMGTELQKYGMPQGICPESWCLKNSDILCKVQSDYKKAGADIVYTCTFGANRIKLSQYKIKDVVLINKQLAFLTRRAVGKGFLVAGNIGPTGKFIKPFGNLGFDDAVDIFKEQIKGLLMGGVDLFAIETMMDIQEARAALIAVKEITNKFTMVTMTYDKSGRTLNGNNPISALITLQSLGADAVGCNCSTGPQDMLRIISSMKPYATVPLAAKPNAGMPKLIGNKTFFAMKLKEFGFFGKKLAFLGVNLIGGCCGTTCGHIASLKKTVKNIKPIKAANKSLSALSSARGFTMLKKAKNVTIIGEKINPTGKKELQKELLEGKFGLIRRFAREQKDNGAKLLDVNVGTPGVNEEKAMLDVISLLSVAADLPLVIDSAKIEVIERALRIYPGRALINSISGDPKKIKKLLALAKKYGAMFVLLPIAGKKIPFIFDDRKKIITKIFNKAKKAGFSRDDIVVDGLVMAISTKPKAAIETLKTIKWCSKVLKCNSVVGLSNISFGLPKRHFINRTFLEMAKKSGLTLVISNPLHIKPLKNKLAQNLLLNKDKMGSKFIAEYSAQNAAMTKNKGKKQTLPYEEQVFRAILEASRDDISDIIKKAVNSGIKPSRLIQETMVSAIVKVGRLFEQKKYFLAQLIASAETMKKGVKYLEPFLKENERVKSKKAVIIMVTVQGDMHDIGKNIVSLILKNHGFQIVDIGKDVCSHKIIKEARIHSADIVGLSALMTTTMVNMKEVVELANKEKLKCKFMVGGAVVTKAYANSIATEYAKDGVDAVRVVERLTNSKKSKKEE